MSSTTLAKLRSVIEPGVKEVAAQTIQEIETLLAMNKGLVDKLAQLQQENDLLQQKQTHPILYVHPLNMKNSEGCWCTQTRQSPDQLPLYLNP